MGVIFLIDSFRFEKLFDKDEKKIISTKDRCVLINEILSRTIYSKRLETSCIFTENDNKIGLSNF